MSVDAPDGWTVETDTGPVDIASVATRAWRIGFAPNPFAWTPWQYANGGRFDGRWDDPDGTYRTLYLSASLRGCLLEVLARFRPDPALALELAAIRDDPDDDPDGVGTAERWPTLPAGVVPLSWLDQREVGETLLFGHFVDVRQAGTIATLRRRFGTVAASLGLPDLDAAALKSTGARPLTQLISSWCYRTLLPPVTGIAFASRHGDEETMWAVFEQGGEHETVSAALDASQVKPLTASLPALAEAMAVHGLVWGDC